MLSPSQQSRLLHQHETTHELVAGFSEEELKNRLNPDKWSIFENIAHLTAYQPTFFERIQKIAVGTEPSFERYVAESDPHFYACVKQPLSSLRQTLNTQRKFICDYVLSLPDEYFSSVGHHPKYGALTLVNWIEFFLLHEAHHLFTIFMLTRELHPVAKK